MLTYGPTQTSSQTASGRAKPLLVSLCSFWGPFGPSLGPGHSRGLSVKCFEVRTSSPVPALLAFAAALVLIGLVAAGYFRHF